MVTERLGWAFALITLLGGCYYLLRLMQLRRAQRPTQGTPKGQPALMVVTSDHCAVCPAQKNVIALLSERYPALRVVSIDAESDLAHLRSLSVMTVPTTLLFAADGSVAQINNGFIALDPLAKQVEVLFQRRVR